MIIFIKNKYYTYYYNIVNHALSRECSPNQLYEKHHIMPKSFGGANNKDNLVKLTPREHFICHKLLTKITTGEFRRKMVYALWRMCTSSKGNRKITSRVYESTKEQFVEILKTVGNGGQFKKGRPTWNKGVPRTEEVKDAISKANKGKKTGRISADFTSEWKEKISLAKKSQNLGENNPMFGRNHSEESKNKLSATRKAKSSLEGWNVRPPCSKEKAERIKLANSGKKWVHNKETKERKYVDPALVSSFLTLGWSLGLGPKKH